jgi:hypothetical protein
MKSIKRRFEIISKKYPQYSGFVVFGETIKGLNFSKAKIVNWFLKLVPGEDWKGCPKKQIIKHFQELSKSR